MSVTRDAVGTVQEVVATSMNIPITIGGGANRSVVLDIALEIADWSGFAATIGGEALTLITGASADKLRIYGKATSLTGAQTVAVSWTTSQRAQGNAISYIGAHQSTPFNNGTGQTAVSPVSLSVTSTSGDRTHSASAAGSAGAAPTTDETGEWSVTAGSLATAGDTGPGTGTT